MSPSSSRPRVIVFGAGAFGGWTALELVRRGARVRLVDAWGPGHARSSSGGETRVLRATYGSHVIYSRMAARALELWRMHDARWGSRLFRQTGVLWMFSGNDAYRHASAEAMRAHGIPIEEPPVPEISRRYQQIDFTGVTSVLVEPDAGYAFARRACAHVADRVVAEGGGYIRAAAAGPLRLEAAAPAVPLLDGSVLDADAFVFACGPWLGQLFPDVVGPLVTPTRQEVYYFGTPPGAPRFQDASMPVWLDLGERCLYGTPDDGHRGFKYADDTPGPAMDPTTDERVASLAGVAAARAFLARRFPALADAPLVASEVCQYESTPDSHFIVDRHPAAPNVWIVGGGSGHGFKMGPVIGEMVASLVLGESDIDPQFALARFATTPAEGWLAKWA